MRFGATKTGTFAADYFGAKSSAFGVSQAVRQKARKITTLIIDTQNLATGKLRFSRAIGEHTTVSNLRTAAAKALAGHTTAEATSLYEALGTTRPTGVPISAPSDIAIGSIWHHGSDFEGFWIGSAASITHYSDTTENERERIQTQVRQLAHQGAVVYAIAKSHTKTQPARYRDADATFLGLLAFQPLLFAGTEQTVAEIRQYGLTIVYASQNPEHVVQSFAHVSCMTPNNAIVQRWRRGHNVALNETLYAQLNADARQQIIEHYGEKALVVKGSLVQFWQQLLILRK